MRNRFGVENHERQRQGQSMEKFMEYSMGEMSTKENVLSQSQDVLGRKVIHHEKKNTCTFVKEEKSREEKLKSVVSTKESEGKRKGSECLIENHESLKEEQVKEKQDEIQKSEETDEEVNLFTNSNNHFLAYFSQSVQKFEVQNMENEGILAYKRYKTISFLPSKSFLSFYFIINKSNSCPFSFFCDRIQSQLLNFLTTTCGTKPNHWMKAKEEGMGRSLALALKTHH
ncbi:hypothetical protein M9H77_07567 [Catharanthus roseus]|uniref:Uncharacterized protein n=1 Tax=Catharanthus roseus TaxID=4058 RepID=A0ACC0BVJ4_CATRO|nr:hypothetical protein M9H77_07567 [Catharanthus roseus]